MIAINFACAKNFDDDIKKKASIYVPTIGKVTTSMLQRNLFRLYKYSTFKFTNGSLNGPVNGAVPVKAIVNGVH